jgi:hypothetical protein
MPFDQNTNINNSVISIDDTPPPPATTIYTISQPSPHPVLLITPIKPKQCTLNMKALLPCPPFSKIAAPNSTTTSLILSLHLANYTDLQPNWD